MLRSRDLCALLTTFLFCSVATPAGAACPPAPLPACRSADLSTLSIGRNADPARDRLRWTWSKGPATSADDFGVPTTSTAYALCAWGPNGLVLDLAVAPGGTCNGRPCWAPKGSAGYQFKDPAGAAAGVRALRLAGGSRGKIDLRAQGPGVPLPPLPLAAPLTIQLLPSDRNRCFESILTAASIRKNDATAVVAKSADAAAAVPALASTGCGQASVLYAAGTTTLDQLVHDGITRTFRVHLPPSYDPSTPMPVVLLLHGGFGSGAQIEANARIVEVADEKGFIAVSPDGVLSPANIRTWNGGGCCGYAVTQNVDDVGFLRAVIDRLEANACTDRRRVYAEGMSNGAIMSYRLACELADRIRAIGPVAGVEMAADCAPPRPVPVMHVHGSADANVPFDGGLGCGPAGVPFPSVPQTIAGWAARDGCRGSPTVARVEGDGTCERQGTCAPATDLQLCVIDGGGHVWPGGTPPVSPGFGSCPFGYQTQTFSATRVLWDFFARHPPR